MQIIKPIETEYSGYRFRSRLEARWAVFFDALGIKWDYEFEGFELSDDSRYLPDFFLPVFEQGMWCEVKPEGGDFTKAIFFSEDTGNKIWLCEGVPEMAIYRYFNGGEPFCGIPLWDQAYDENRMFGMPCNFSCGDLCRDKSQRVLIDDEESDIFHRCDVADQVFDAIKSAKQARFEHGETGLVHISSILKNVLTGKTE